MQEIINYVKPELLIVSVVLYFLGLGMKHAQIIKDKYIPIFLGVAGIIICAIYVFASCSCRGAKEIAMAIFTAVTQGILVAGLSTYVNQVFKQLNKKE